MAEGRKGRTRGRVQSVDQCELSRQRDKTGLNELKTCVVE